MKSEVRIYKKQNISFAPMVWCLDESLISLFPTITPALSWDVDYLIIGYVETNRSTKVGLYS